MTAVLGSSHAQFEGLMFPWESAFTGAEVDPASGTTIEEHIEGDIAFAFLQHWQATLNTTWLTTAAYPVMQGLAAFWASKAYANQDGTYSIGHIMGPVRGIPGRLGAGEVLPMQVAVIVGVTVRAPVVAGRVPRRCHRQRLLQCGGQVLSGDGQHGGAAVGAAHQQHL